MRPRFLGTASFSALSAVLSVTMLHATAAVAQATASGSISGFVLDPDQAAIPGAKVTLTSASGKTVIVTSGADGSYHFRNVAPGVYSLTVTMQGFSTFARQNLRVGETAIALNTPLAVQAESTQVDVTTQNAQVSVDPDSNSSSVVIKDKDLEALSDDPDELSDQLSALAGPSAGPSGGQIYIDGFTGGTLPPKSSIREIRVNQNPFSAQFDKQGFGRVEVFTKPGTDKIHGQFSLQGNTKGFNTSSPFLGSSNEQPDYHRIFTIGSLTGPLTKSSSYSLAGSYRDIQDNSIFAGQIISTGPTSAVLCSPGDVSCSLNTYPDASRATFHPQTRIDFTPRLDMALTPNNTLIARYQFNHNSITNGGLGSTSLNTTAYNTTTTGNDLQLSDTQTFGSKVVNETRLELSRDISTQTPVSTAPTLTLTGYFSGGGSSLGTQNSTIDHFEFQNYTSIALRKNFIRAGVRLRVNREAIYSTEGSNGTFTYQSAADYLNNQPFQYKVTVVNNPKAETHLSDVGFYAEDDWRVKPNLSISYGLRYEAQGAIHSAADLAPRFAISYGIPRKQGNPTTVLRGGWGVFYDRFTLSDELQTLLQNGANQLTNIYRSPSVGCSPTNITPCGSGAAAAATIYQLGPNLRSAYLMQTQVGVEQQVNKRTTISANYLNSIGVHQYLSRVIPSTGTDLLYQYQSGGVFRQNQFMVNVRAQIGPKFSIFGFYALNYANSNANGADNFPTDSLNPKTDYGRALFVNKHRALMFGNWNAPYGINLSPFMAINSGSYYNITTGTDVNGDSIINDRAGFANGVSGDCKNALDFTANVTSANRVSPGYCQGPPNVDFNLRISKVFGFGKKNNAPANQENAQGGLPQGPPPGGGGPGGGGPGGGGGRGPGGGGPGGPGGFFGGASSGKKYSLNVGAQIQNLFNFVPYSTPSGALTSYSADPSKNLFGKSTSLASFGPGGSSAAVRTITLQATFVF